MPDGTVPLLIALIILVIFSGFFSATETAFTSVNKIKLRALESNGNKRAGKILELAENGYEKLLSTILVGNNIVNLSASTISTLMFAKIIVSDTALSSLISTIVITVAVLLFGEISPKFIAKSAPEKFASFFYPLILPFFYLFYPLNLFFSGWKWILKKIFRFKNDEVITEDEIMTVVEEAEEDGTLREDETNLIRSVIEFDDLEVGDVLVPRVNMVAIDVETPLSEIKNIFLKEGYSRLPVYKNGIDTVIGTIHEKDFYRAYMNGNKTIDGILQNAFYTTEHVKISALLKQLQKTKTHIAIVLDEYGGTLGLITLEDILEELVGEIYDEHDEVISYFKQVNENEYVVLGDAPMSDTLEYFGVDDKENEYEANTLSGFVIEVLGKIPSIGEKFEMFNLSFEVLKATIKKVLQVKVTRLETTEE